MTEALKVNAGLTLVDISDNQVHEPGMRAIALALKDMTVGQPAPAPAPEPETRNPNPNPV